MQLIDIQRNEDGSISSAVFDCTEETSPTSPLRKVYVNVGLSYENAKMKGRTYIGQNTRKFYADCKSVQRQRLIQQINTILDSLPN
jgi:hypothetical protein